MIEQPAPASAPTAPSDPLVEYLLGTRTLPSMLEACQQRLRLLAGQPLPSQDLLAISDILLFLAELQRASQKPAAKSRPLEWLKTQASNIKRLFQ